MRYEHIEMDLSTAALAEIRDALAVSRKAEWGFSVNAIANQELHNLFNEIEARLQRRDPDPHAPKNFEPDLTGGIEL